MNLPPECPSPLPAPLTWARPPDSPAQTWHFGIRDEHPIDTNLLLPPRVAMCGLTVHEDWLIVSGGHGHQVCAGCWINGWPVIRALAHA